MAKIFSWKLNGKEKEGYAYLAKKQGNTWGEGYEIRPIEEKVTEDSELRAIAGVVNLYTRADYERYFTDLKTEALRDYGVQLKNYESYYEVNGGLLILSGEDGDNSEAGRTFLVFKNADRNSKPAIPPSSVKVVDGELVGLEGTGWSTDNVSPTKPNVTWMSSAYFNLTTGEKVTNWIEPFIITGSDGRNGSDSEQTEFIYARTSSPDKAPSYPDVQSELKTLFDNCEKYRQQKYLETTWYDSPQGIEKKNYPVEWVAYRTNELNEEGQRTGNWIYCTSPIKWSIWGEDGTDGDGVEYIYAVTDHHGGLNKDGSYIYPSDALVPPTSWADIKEIGWDKYNKDEFLPGDPWTDEPMDVGPKQPYEWVSIRKYKSDGISHFGEDANLPKWNPFSEPVLWNRWAEKGETVFTSYIFTRSNDKNITKYYLRGGTFEHPHGTEDEPIRTFEDDKFSKKVENIKWHDTVPKGGEPVYMSYNMFGDKGTYAYAYANVISMNDDEIQSYFDRGLIDDDFNTHFNAEVITNKFLYEGQASTTPWTFKTTEDSYALTVVVPEGFELAEIYDADNHQTVTDVFDIIQENIQVGNYLYKAYTYLVDSGINAATYRVTFKEIFSSEETGWSHPVLWTDSQIFQVEYSSDYLRDESNLPSLDLFTERKDEYTIVIPDSEGSSHAGTYTVTGEYDESEGVNEVAWRNLCKSAGYGEWRDVSDNGPDAENPIYMATARRVNGEWTPWTVSKIKGEDGDAGTSITLKGTLVYAYEINDPTQEAVIPGELTYKDGDIAGTFYNMEGDRNLWEIIHLYKFSEELKGWKILNGEKEGDCYYAPIVYGFEGEVLNPGSGHLIKWNATGEGQWEDAGEWKGKDGEPGKTTYMHTAFANEVPEGGYVVIIFENGGYKEVRIKLTDPTPDKEAGETPGTYFGIYTDEIQEAETRLNVKWSWARWGGEDGYGMEQIFRLGNADYTDQYGNPITVPTEDTEYEQEPVNWTDKPLAPTSELPYCFMCYRHYNKDRKWHGEKQGDEELPIVWNRYVEDGKSPVVLTISNDNMSILVRETFESGVTKQYSIVKDAEVSTVVLSYGLSTLTNISKIEFSNDASKIIEQGGGIETIEKDGKLTGEIRTTIIPGMDMSEIDDIQVDVTALTEDNEKIQAEGHISVTKVASNHLYEVTTSRDTIHKTYDGQLLEGQGPIYVFLQRQWENQTTELIERTEQLDSGDFKLTFKVDAGNETVIPISDLAPITGVSTVTAMKAYSVDEQKNVEHTLTLTVYSYIDGNWVFNDSETVTVVNNGKNGQDGTSMEYVYHLFPKDIDAREKDEDGNYKWLNQQIGRIRKEDGSYEEWTEPSVKADFMPWDNQTDGDGNKTYWTDSPESVEYNTNEWAAIRYKKSGSEEWELFGEPTIWASYGNDGKDGDGVEYVFRLTKDNQTPAIAETHNYTSGETIPDYYPYTDSTKTIFDPAYDNDRGWHLTTTPGTYESSYYNEWHNGTEHLYWGYEEWIPFGLTQQEIDRWADFTSLGNRATVTINELKSWHAWTDDPQSTTEELRYQWVSKRKYDGENKKWKPFGVPSIWNNYADTGAIAELTNDTVYVGTKGDYILDTGITTDDIWAYSVRGITYATDQVMVGLTLNGKIVSGITEGEGVKTVNIPTDDEKTIVFTWQNKQILKLGNKDISSVKFSVELPDKLNMEQSLNFGIELRGSLEDDENFYSNASFKIVPLKSGDEAVQENILIEPNAISVNPNGTPWITGITISVYKREGKADPQKLAKLEDNARLWWYCDDDSSYNVNRNITDKYGEIFNVLGIFDEYPASPAVFTVRYEKNIKENVGDPDNWVKFDSESVNITRDGKGSQVADFDNDNILISTGEDNNIESDVSGLISDLFLKNSGESCKDLEITHIVLKGGCVDNDPTKGSYNTDVTLSKGTTPKAINISSSKKVANSKILMSYAVEANSIKIYTKLCGDEQQEDNTGLYLNNTYNFTFTITGKTNDEMTVQAMATLRIGGLKGGVDASYLSLKTSVKDIHLMPNGQPQGDKMNVGVQLSSGNKPVEWLPSGTTIYWESRDNNNGLIKGGSVVVTITGKTENDFYGFTSGETTNNVNYGTLLYSSLIDATHTYEDVKSVVFKVVNEVGLTDSETVFIVKDGKDGVASEYADFDDENIQFGIGSNRKLEGVFTANPKFYLHCGNKKFKEIKVTKWSFESGNKSTGEYINILTGTGSGSKTSGGYSITAGTATTSTEGLCIPFTIQINGGTGGLDMSNIFRYKLSATCSGTTEDGYEVSGMAYSGLIPTADGEDGETYQLVISPNSIVSGTSNFGQCVIQVQHTSPKTGSNFVTGGTVSVYRANSSTPITSTTITSTSGIQITSLSSYTSSLVFKLSQNGFTDTETIPYLKNGTNGINAKTYEIIATSTGINYDGEGKNPNPNRLEFVAYEVEGNNRTPFYGYWFKNNTRVGSYSNSYTYDVEDGLSKLDISISPNTTYSSIVATKSINITRNGINGNSGSSPIAFDFTNDNILVGVGSDGVLQGDFTGTTICKLYKGSSAETINNITTTSTSTAVTISYSGSGNARTITYKVKNGFSAVTNVDITANYNGGSITKTLVFTPVKNGKDGESYNIVTNPTSIQVGQDGKWSSNTITVNVEHIVGGTAALLPTSETVTYRVDTESIDHSANVGTSISVSGYTSAKSITFTYTKDGFTDVETVNINRDGQGAKGDRGPSIRGPREWVSGQTYCSGDENVYNITVEENKKYIDVVVYDNKTYKCITGHTGSVWNANFWSKADEFDFVATKLLLADRGSIDFLQNQKILLKNGSSETTAGAQGGSGISFWAGSVSADSAAFKVKYNGQVDATNLNITGGSIKIGDNFNVDNQGNLTGNNANLNGNLTIGRGGTIQAWGKLILGGSLDTRSLQVYGPSRTDHDYTQANFIEGDLLLGGLSSLVSIMGGLSIGGANLVTASTYTAKATETILIATRTTTITLPKLNDNINGKIYFIKRRVGELTLKASSGDKVCLNGEEDTISRNKIYGWIVIGLTTTSTSGFWELFPFNSD